MTDVLHYPEAMSDTSNTKARPYDVIVWGATGFTGQLVADYLQQHYPNGQDLCWAIAGRNSDKLQQVRDALPAAEMQPDIIVADSNDASSLDEMCRQARVVLTTVGPYALYGDNLVASCVSHGTHYCDLAGEVQWIRRMIDKHQEAAKQSGAMIVNCCGFDSIPSDIGVHFLQSHAVEAHGKPCTRVETLVRAMKGGGSGGTIASGLNALKESKNDRAVARILVDPYSLNPIDERQGPDGRDQNGIRYSELAQTWTAPFVMAIINMRIVRRSNALLDYAYGKEFMYSESMVAGDGTMGWIKSAAITATLGGMLAASSFGPTRSMLVEPLVPKPGEGPDAEERENGFYNFMLIGELEDGSTVRAKVTGDRDPGYGSTCKMLSESAICLAKDEIGAGGGFWTPASAMGDKLRERLVANAGLTFEIKA